MLAEVEPESGVETCGAAVIVSLFVATSWVCLAVDTLVPTDAEVDLDMSRLSIFGDPSMHDMALYKRRIDELAVAAVTGRD